MPGHGGEGGSPDQGALGLSLRFIGLVVGAQERGVPDPSVQALGDALVTTTAETPRLDSVEGAYRWLNVLHDSRFDDHSVEDLVCALHVLDPSTVPR